MTWNQHPNELGEQGSYFANIRAVLYYNKAYALAQRKTKNINFPRLLRSNLLLKSPHDSRPMLGAGSSSGWTIPGIHVAGWGRLEDVSLSVQSPHSHVVCPPSLNPRFCIRALHRPVTVRRRFRLDQVGHASLEPVGSDSLGLKNSVWSVVWRWLVQRVSLRVHELPSRGSNHPILIGYPSSPGSHWPRTIKS